MGGQPLQHLPDIHGADTHTSVALLWRERGTYLHAPPYVDRLGAHLALHFPSLPSFSLESSMYKIMRKEGAAAAAAATAAC